MKKEKIVKEKSRELLDQLGISAELTVTETDGAVGVVIETADAGILIGYHGETLNALALVLSLLVSQELGEFTRVNVDVGDYRKQREEKLQELAKNIKEQVLRQKQEVPIPNLTAGERRIIHLFFQDDQEVVSESQGEGETRQLIIKPR